MLVLLKNLARMEKVVAHGAQPLPDGGTTGYFFIENIEGFMSIASEGVFLDSADGLIRSVGYPRGLTYSAFVAETLRAGSSGCNDPYYVPRHWAMDGGTPSSTPALGSGPVPDSGLQDGG